MSLNEKFVTAYSEARVPTCACMECPCDIEVENWGQVCEACLIDDHVPLR